MRRDARPIENLGGVRAFLHGKREQQPLDRDIRVARLLRDLLGIFENARRRRGEIQLSRGRTLHLRQFGKREFRVAERVARAPACSLDEPRGKSLLVVEKDLQNMFGRELLVTLADGERLGALNKAARSFGIFFHIHDGYLPFAKPPLMPAAIRERT